MKALLALSIVMLGGAILWVGSGQVGPFISSVVKGFGGFVTQVGVVAGSPKPTDAPDLADAPSIEVPEKPYTNQDKVDVTVNVPPAVTGLEGYTVRLYVTLEDEEPQLLVEEPVGDISVPGALGRRPRRRPQRHAGRDHGPGRGERTFGGGDLGARPVQAQGECDLAQEQRAGQEGRGDRQGQVPGRRGDPPPRTPANGAIATVVAGKDNLWETTLAIADGSNAITVTATDPAGNENTDDAQRAKGLRPPHRRTLTSSAYRFKASRLPKSITLTVAVTGPDGRRVAGATALFTISVPGLEAIVSRRGRDQQRAASASFTTTIPAGATPGGGLATVLVTSGNGTTTDRQVLTITK